VGTAAPQPFTIVGQFRLSSSDRSAGLPPRHRSPAGRLSGTLRATRVDEHYRVRGPEQVSLESYRHPPPARQDSRPGPGRQDQCRHLLPAGPTDPPPRQIEDWIETGVPVHTVEGGVEFATPSGTTMVRIITAFAAEEGARQHDTQFQRSAQSRVPTGVQPLDTHRTAASSRTRPQLSVESTPPSARASHTATSPAH
jgi:hypothetical protein